MAEVAALVGDPARVAGVSASTASAHLGKLLAAGLVRVEARGRTRSYRLAGARVGHALEALAALAPPRAAAVGGESTHEVVPAIRRARMCYDHVAGQLGVALSDALVARRWLALEGGDYAIGKAGRRGFARLGVEVAALEGARRPLLRACTDWTERREHLGGALGAALASHLLGRAWIVRDRGERTLRVTALGRRGLARALGLREAW